MLMAEQHLDRADIGEVDPVWWTPTMLLREVSL
jgi:hypothetical protein